MARGKATKAAVRKTVAKKGAAKTVKAKAKATKPKSKPAARRGKAVKGNPKDRRLERIRLLITSSRLHNMDPEGDLTFLLSEYDEAIRLLRHARYVKTQHVRQIRSLEGNRDGWFSKFLDKLHEMKSGNEILQAIAERNAK